MYVVAIVIHVTTCLLLIGVVLLQQGKGADMGAVFGGSSSTIFGSGGAGNFLTRLTTGLAIVFMLTSLTLTYASARSVSTSVFDGGPLGQPPPLEAPDSAPGAASGEPASAPGAASGEPASAPGAASGEPAPQPGAQAPAPEPKIAVTVDQPVQVAPVEQGASAPAAPAGEPAPQK